MIIPVLDLKNKLAVSGKSGERDTYKPLKTVFSGSSEPIKISKSLHEAGAHRMYIADLDAIESRGSNFDIIKKINADHVSVMLDSGAKNIDDVKKSTEVADKVIVATETLESIDELTRIFNNFDKNRLIISVDIKDGHIFSKYLNISPEELVEKIKELNPLEVIILDISKVGTEKGVNIEFIKKFIEFKDSLIIGGGIIDKDIDELKKMGINKFLVGSTLHNGKLSL